MQKNSALWILRATDGCVSDLKYGSWTISSYEQEAATTLATAGWSPITAAVLCSRGYDTPEKAQAFLSPDVPLSSPFDLLDMDKAAARVKRALERREHICVFGDYDVDGITATCLLTDFLRKRGGHVTSYIPARLEEGYGLNEIAVRALHEQDVKLIITVDCGITANQEAALCRELGMELVITDHHECKLELPEAVAVVDPHRKEQPEPILEMAGVGVAFKLAAALHGDQEALLAEYCDLLCLGTVADVMPLTGENRKMVWQGLQALANPKRVGIAALMAECGAMRPPITAGTIGYTLAPRINAAGRMGHVDIATELFLTNDAARAVSLASQLCKLNRKRQDVESGIYKQAVSMLPAGKSPKAIVLADETWHQGVVGIVASRLAEEYSCPTFLICLDGDKGKASSRSYGGFNLFASLEQLSDLLESYGGHELAAGFTIRREQIDLFRERILALTDAFSRSPACNPSLKIDCEIPPQLLTVPNVQQLDELEPCGAGCPRPVLYMRNMTVTDLSEVGGGKHLRLRLSGHGYHFNGIFFSTTARLAAVALGDVVDIAYTPQVNEYRGLRTVQLNLLDIRPNEQARSRLKEGKALYRRHMQGQALSQDDLERLIPARQDFVAVWKYLAASAQNGVVCEEFGCLARKITRFAGYACGGSKIRVCLDVFQEQGLLQMEQRPKLLVIHLTSDGKKVDLEQSPTLQHLKERLKAGI